MADLVRSLTEYGSDGEDSEDEEIRDIRRRIGIKPLNLSQIQKIQSDYSPLKAPRGNKYVGALVLCLIHP